MPCHNTQFLVPVRKLSKGVHFSPIPPDGLEWFLYLCRGAHYGICRNDYANMCLGSSGLSAGLPAHAAYRKAIPIILRYRQFATCIDTPEVCMDIRRAGYRFGYYTVIIGRKTTTGAFLRFRITTQEATFGSAA